MDWLAEVAGFEHLHQEICIPLASMLSAGRASTAAASAQHLLPLFGPHDSGKPNRTCFLMRKVEPCRPSISNASHAQIHDWAGVRRRRSVLTQADLRWFRSVRASATLDQMRILLVGAWQAAFL